MNLADATSYRDTNLDLEASVSAALAAIGKPAEGNKGGGSNTRTRTRTAHPHRDAMRKAADNMLAIEEALGKLERAMATLVKLGEGGPRGMEKRLGEISTRLLAVEDQAAELHDDDEEE